MTPHLTYQNRVVPRVCSPWIDDFLCHAFAKNNFYSTIYTSKYTARHTSLLTNGSTGKERDVETGYGYFGARYMDHELMTMWLSVDPMADKYPSISPYAYCTWNPVKLVDPDGRERNPVYGSDGLFRGCTKEGFASEIIIYDGNKDFTNLSKEELFRKDDNAMPYSLANTSMTDDAKSKMYTHIVSQYEGECVLGTIFSMNDVHDSKIKFDKNKPGNWCTTYESKGGLGESSDIYATDHYLQTYAPTVENIQSSIIFHEWFSHKIQGCSDETGNHQQAYQNVKDGPLWRATTDCYKDFNQKKFIDYEGK